jgi:hypothetical protein
VRRSGVRPTKSDADKSLEERIFETEKRIRRAERGISEAREKLTEAEAHADALARILSAKYQAKEDSKRDWFHQRARDFHKASEELAAAKNEVSEKKQMLSYQENSLEDARHELESLKGRLEEERRYGRRPEAAPSDEPGNGSQEESDTYEAPSDASVPAPVLQDAAAITPTVSLANVRPRAGSAMSSAASDPYNTLSAIDSMSWFEGLWEGVKANYIARNKERVADGLIRQVAAQKRVNKAIEGLHITTRHAAPISIGAEQSARQYWQVQANQELTQYNPEPLQYVRELPPVAAQEPAPPLVETMLTDEQIAAFVTQSAAQIGSDYKKWMEWTQKVVQRCPSQAGLILATAQSQMA